jgi:nicotinamide phosphoribosyltransferase
MKRRPHLALDSYKLGHIDQYPKGTEYVYSNFTARSLTHARMPSTFDGKVVFTGLQGFTMEFLIEEWNEGFFQRPKAEVVAEYKRRCDAFLGPDSVRVDHIAALHDLGYLPIVIKALDEGSRVDIKVPFLTIRNTHPAFFWLTNYLETVLSCELWKPITVGTIAFEYRRLINKYATLTGSDPMFVNWQAHDFSMRGMSGRADSAKCGAAHLMCAGSGTDALLAIDYLEDYYGADVTKELVAGSVPATEHSVMCMGGKEDEVGTFRRLITETYPSGIVSIVSDTWDFWAVITRFTKLLKAEILARKEDAFGNAKVVFRPDSGDPVKILTGLKVKEITDLHVGECVAWEFEDDYDAVKYEGKFYEFDASSSDTLRLGKEIPEHVVKGAVECLWDEFGGTVTDKGFKTIDRHVGLIYGDSITLERCETILQRLMDKGFSAGNVVFGIGSYTYQYITRDTFGMAVKATWGIVNGEERDIQKDPATDSGSKKSAKGLLRVEKEGDNFVLYDCQRPFQEESGQLKEVFRDGKVVNFQTFAEIKQRLHG